MLAASPLTTIQTDLQFLLGPVLSFIVTVAIAIVAITKWREKKAADITEATSTWRELAESRRAKMDELEEQNRLLRELQSHYNFRLDFLWAAIESRARLVINRKMKAAEATHNFDEETDA